MPCLPYFALTGSRLFYTVALPQPPESRRLSEVVGRDIFFSTSFATDDKEMDSTPKTPVTPIIHVSAESPAPSGTDSLTASPYDVKPYVTARKPVPASALDSPTARRIEGVYDRFLMATSGVKRLGRGYQSDNAGPLSNSVSSPAAPARLPAARLFHTARRAPMPPPVSSEDVRRAASEDHLRPGLSARDGSRSVDELGIMRPSTREPGPSSAQKGHTQAQGQTVRTVRSAFRAMVSGKTVIKKSSRLH
jgi:serine/threonine-protein kinase GIN4